MGRKKHKPRKKVTPSKKSPREQLAALIGVDPSDDGWQANATEYKKKIVSEIAPFLDRYEGESVSELTDRLLEEGGISNKKLLRLKRVTDRLRNEFDGKKENIIDALMETRKGEAGKVDETYRNHLAKKSLATLMLTYDHAKKAGEID